MEINISPFVAKLLLKINPFSKIMIMCKGYGEDYENFTELVWKDDRYLDFSDRNTYPQFQLWCIQ